MVVVLAQVVASPLIVVITSFGLEDWKTVFD